MSAETLSVQLESSVLRQLEQLARESGLDVARFVEHYLNVLARVRETTVDSKALPPNTRRALGLLRGAPDRPYKELLEDAIWEKHGG